MKWVKRGLWLAAWGCWVWMGFRICPELPRETGAAVASKEFAKGEFRNTPRVRMMYDIQRDEDDPKPMTRYSFETVFEIDRHDFLVEERWDELWKAWLPDFKYKTYAWRSLRDTSLKYRTVGSFAVLPKNMNADRTLFALGDGSLYRLPLAPNYPLLALCQTILALPLVLLWAALRWRRKRRMPPPPAVSAM